MYTQGVWWYRSIKYGHTNILLQTTQIFLYFMSKSKLLPVKREHAGSSCQGTLLLP